MNWALQTPRDHVLSLSANIPIFFANVRPIMTDDAVAVFDLAKTHQLLAANDKTDLTARCFTKAMQRLFKTIGAVGVVALTLAAVAQSSAQMGTKTHFTETFLCLRALNSERSGWDNNSEVYVAEAARRGLTVEACRQMLAQPSSAPTDNPTASTSNLPDRALCVNADGLTVYSCRLLLAQPFFPPTSSSPESGTTSSGTGEQRAFLEAALFFLTGVDATSDEIVSERQIVLRRYPLVAYLVDGKPCVVRLRNTTSHQIWQLDFCKITSYEWSVLIWRWNGKPDAFCVSTWGDSNIWEGKPDENFTDPDFTKTGRPVECGLFGTNNVPGGTIAFDGNWDADWFTTGYENRYERMRSQQRVMASFKHIRTLLTPPEQRKPY
jgi:hypothetical protein